MMVYQLLVSGTRGIYIYGNLQAVTENHDKVLIIYGASHIKILSELIKNYNNMELEDAMIYLGR